jgi:hypothetical protein
MPKQKTYTAKNGALYTKNARGQVRFISGASPAYLAKIRKKRGKKKGGGTIPQAIAGAIKRKRKRRGGSLLGPTEGMSPAAVQAKVSNLARVGRKIRKRRGGGLKQAGRIAGMVAYGATTPLAALDAVNPMSDHKASKMYARNMKKGFKATGKVARKAHGGGFSLHNKMSIGYKARGVKSKTQLGF